VPGGARRPGQRPGAALGPARNLDAPGGQVIGDVEVDRDELDSAHLVDQLGEGAWPAASISPKDRLQRIALALVGALVDEEAHRGVLGLAGPNVPSKLPTATTLRSSSSTSP
jgi:hypothetical protein